MEEIKIKISLGCIVFLIIGICVQIFLSKKDNKLLGLLLPIITFVNSLLFSLQSFTLAIGVKAFIVTNISTVVLLIVYLICKSSKMRTH
jgi:hypothetical protein